MKMQLRLALFLFGREVRMFNSIRVQHRQVVLDEDDYVLKFENDIGQCHSISKLAVYKIALMNKAPLLPPIQPKWGAGTSGGNNPGGKPGGFQTPESPAYRILRQHNLLTTQCVTSFPSRVICSTRTLVKTCSGFSDSRTH